MHCITAIRLFPCAHVQGEFGDQIRSAGGGGVVGVGVGGLKYPAVNTIIAQNLGRIRNWAKEL